MFQLRLAIVVITVGLNVCLSQSDTVVTKVVSPVSVLDSSSLGQGAVNDSTEPYKSGSIGPDLAPLLIKALGGDSTKTTIIHLLRWADADHTKSKFDKWYLYDPSPSKTSFYLQSKQQTFEQTAIPGRTDFQFIYIHLNSDLSAGTSEWQDANGKFKHPFGYTVTVSKAETQFLQDIQTALQILGIVKGPGIAPEPAHPGYYSVSTFTSQWTTSSVVITAALDSQNKDQGAKDPASGSTSQFASKTYTNERPSYIGLSAGIQVTKYQDVTFQQAGNTLVPSTITKQNVYLFLDGYFPPVLPGLTSFRYIPHPIIGLPIKGKVFRHSMIGLGVGLKWLEPYGGVVFDTENNQIKGTAPSTDLTIRPVFGLKVSVSAVAKALKGK